MMVEFWMALAGGATAFAHCLGMCGGFPLHLASLPGRGGRGAGNSGQDSAGSAEVATAPLNLAALWRQLSWHAGRIFTYAFLGALAGFLGTLPGSALHLAWLGKLLSASLGGLMVLMGLSVLGLLPFRRPRAGGDDAHAPGLAAQLYQALLARASAGGAFALGLATGLLPCPVVLAFLALSAQRGSVADGVAIMLAMGLGTSWSLALLGLTGRGLAKRLARWGPALAGAVLIVLGLTTALRATDLYHTVLCRHGGSPAGATMPASSCCTRPAP